MKLYKFGFVLLFCISSTVVFAQIDSLKEVIFSANKVQEPKSKVAQSIDILTQEDIQQSQALTTADVLSQNGIAVQRSQLGGGSPVLRGLEASRIVLEIDGIRMNNLIYRAGHLQDIIKTDHAILDRIEVVYGPSSTMYGSDALGGVIHMYTIKPTFSKTEKTEHLLKVSSRYQSASNAITEHFDFNIGGKKLASLTSFTYSNFDDLKGGKNKNPFYRTEYGTRPYYALYLGNGTDVLVENPNKYKQVGSGYSQYDILQKIHYKPNDKSTHKLNLQYSNSSNVPRYDRLTDPSSTTGLRSAEWYYGPQERLLAAYDLVLKNAYSFDEIRFGVHYQMLEESRHNRNFNSKNLNHRIEKVKIVGASLDFVQNYTNHDLRFGLDMQMNSLNSRAYAENIVTGETRTIDSRYPDGNNHMNNVAAYLSHTWNIVKKWSIVDGFRIGFSKLHSTIQNPEIMFNLPFADIRQDMPTYSGNIGIIHTPSHNTKLSFLISTGFRVPNVDDLAKIFESSTNRVVVPNPDLNPEKTINYEVGFVKSFGVKTHWEAAVFYTDYRDITVVDTYSYNGSDYILYDGVLSNVYANQNRDKAYIYGINSSFNTSFNERLSWLINFNYSYGRVKTEGEDAPLDHIPPFMAHTSIRYQYQSFHSSFFVNYSAWKKLKDYSNSGEDNLQYATEEGMPAWITFNLRASYQIAKSLSVETGIDNLLDTQYRTFASGINAPGRNFIVGVRGSF